jgi:hypothetical protein
MALVVVHHQTTRCERQDSYQLARRQHIFFQRRVVNDIASLVRNLGIALVQDSLGSPEAAGIGALFAQTISDLRPVQRVSRPSDARPNEEGGSLAQ